MTPDHEQMVLEAAAAIWRARGEHERADLICGKLPGKRGGRVSEWSPGPNATVLQRRIHERMIASGSNSFRLATEAGLGRDFVRDLFRGKVKSPSALSLSRLAKALKTSSDYLLGETDEP